MRNTHITQKPQYNRTAMFENLELWVEILGGGFVTFCLSILTIKVYGFFRREKQRWS